jgi:hypothetical protein
MKIIFDLHYRTARFTPPSVPANYASTWADHPIGYIRWPKLIVDPIEMRRSLIGGSRTAFSIAM